MPFPLNNPVARRELLVLFRTHWLGVMALAYLTILGLVVFSLWPDSALFSLNAQASRSIVLILVTVQILLVMLYAPAFTAPSIISEKENNSYDLLFFTEMKPIEVLQGKLTAVISVLLLFVLFSFPFFACCFLLGAVSAQETLILYGLSVLTAVLTGLIGLVVSARATSSHAALIRTYLWMMVLGAGPWLPGTLFDPQTDLGAYASAMKAISPLGACASVLIPGFDDAVLERLQLKSWPVFMIFAVIAIVLLRMVLAFQFARQGGRQDVDPKIIDDPGQARQRKLRFPFYLVDPQRRRRPLPGWMNPVFAREIRARAQRGGVWFLRGAYLCFTVSLLLMVLVLGRAGGQDLGHIYTIALVFQLGLVVLLAPALSAGSISQERETSNLDILRLSRIGPGRLIHGKLLMSLVFVLFLIVGSIPLWIVITYMQLTPLRYILICWQIIVATIALSISLGLACSSCSRKSSTATAAAYGILFLICVATLFPLLMPGRLTAPLEFSIQSLNPFLACIFLLNRDPLQIARPLWKLHLIFSCSLTIACLLLAYLRVWFLFNPERRA